MKISTRRDIDAPAEAVFAALSDFDRHESRARSNGIGITRRDDRHMPADAAWDILADIRGIRRRIEARVVSFDAPRQLALRGLSDGLSALIESDITDRPAGRATLHVSVDLAPAALEARLVLHSLKLARGALITSLDRRLDRLARSIEAGA